MTQEQLLPGLKREVLSLLISAKGGMTLEQLKRDYHSMLGFPLPLRPLGYHTVLEMVQDMPDVVAVEYSGDGGMVLRAIGDESTRGIEELVSRQRNAKPKVLKKKTGRGSFYPPHAQRTPLFLPRRGHAPPALPAQLRCQLRQLLSLGPIALSELEQTFSSRFGRPLQVTRYGFYSVGELLAAASDLVAVEQSRMGSLLRLKAGETLQKQKPGPSSAQTRQQLTATQVSAPVSEAGSIQTDVSNFLPETCPSNTAEDGPDGGDTLSEPKPVLEEKHFENSVKKLEEELRDRILECGAAGTVSPELKEKLHRVVTQSSNGISILDLPREFKRLFGEDLPVTQCGFLSVTEMVAALNDTLYLQPGPEKDGNHWIIMDVQQKGTQQGSKQGDEGDGAELSLNTVSGGYYFSCEDSPWEARGEGGLPSDPLEAGAELKVTNNTFQMVDMFPTTSVQRSGATWVPLDALCKEKLRAPTRRRERELVAVLVEMVESPSHFYVRFDESREARALENMMIEMRSCYTCPEVAERYRLPEGFVRPGQVCCLAPQGIWFYRVVIHRVLNDSQVEVYYVDFGDLKVAERSNLKFLKSCYSELPAQAVPSLLTGVRPKGGTWSKSAVSYFRKLCCERTLVAAIHSYQGDDLQLFLCDTHTEEDVYIHSALQAEGHAIPCAIGYAVPISRPFNPVTFYLGAAVNEDGMEKDLTARRCPDLSSGGSPKRSAEPVSHNLPSHTTAENRAEDAEVDLSDLPALELISIADVDNPAQTKELNPFMAVLGKDCVSCSDWDQGWVPGSASEANETKSEPGLQEGTGSVRTQVHLSGDLVPQVEQIMLFPEPEEVADVKPPGMEKVSKTLPSAPQPVPAGQPSTQGGMSSICLQPMIASFMMPLLMGGDRHCFRHTSPSVLGSAARLAAGMHHLNWYPYKLM